MKATTYSYPQNDTPQDDTESLPSNFPRLIVLLPRVNDSMKELLFQMHIDGGVLIRPVEKIGQPDAALGLLHSCGKATDFDAPTASAIRSMYMLLSDIAKDVEGQVKTPSNPASEVHLRWGPDPEPEPAA